MSSWKGQAVETTSAIHMQGKEDEVEVVIEYFEYDGGAEITFTLNPLLSDPNPNGTPKNNDAKSHEK